MHGEEIPQDTRTDEADGKKREMTLMGAGRSTHTTRVRGLRRGPSQDSARRRRLHKRVVRHRRAPLPRLLHLPRGLRWHGGQHDDAQRHVDEASP